MPPAGRARANTWSFGKVCVKGLSLFDSSILRLLDRFSHLLLGHSMAFLCCTALHGAAPLCTASPGHALPCLALREWEAVEASRVKDASSLLQIRSAFASHCFPSFTLVSSWHIGVAIRESTLAVRSRIQGSRTQWVDPRLWQNDFVLPPPGQTRAAVTQALTT
jgi:hypothetical protein